MALVTLLTDFGMQDVYVGVMKGAIAQIHPSLTVIDLTHEIPPQDLAAARFNLMNAYPYFPVGTVHVAVVDPGVGSRRRAIALQLPEAFLVGPDNGIFSGILQQHPAIAAVELTDSRYWRTAVPSATFHGRDIFAPVAAHLASGVPLQDLGRRVDPADLVTLNLPACESVDSGIHGCIQYCDRFGNLVTNVPEQLVKQQNWCVEVGTTRIPKKSTYSEVAFGNLLSLIGSHGWVEVAANGINAQAVLNVQIGDPIRIRLNSQEADT